MELEQYGPQRKSEPKLLRRIRAHQSWYRFEVLGLDRWGKTAPPGEREMGSILTAEDSASGVNFESTEAYAAYLHRRTLGWGVEPYRCERYMTSSQTMTFNIFAPVASDHRWLSKSLSALGYGKPTGPFGFEFRADLRRSSWLDKTVIDAFIPTTKGALVIETKLADQFSRRGTSLRAASFYERINSELRLWKMSSNFEVGAIDQLARVHGAGSAAVNQVADLMLVHHPLDLTTPKKVEGYRRIMTDPTRLRLISLELLLDVFAEEAAGRQQRQAIERLRNRYLEMSMSQAMFNALESRRLMK